ncbi:UNVERIFIED_CONTAM: hypothetical protein K2H54_043358 [Gekko kuhli]
MFLDQASGNNGFNLKQEQKGLCTYLKMALTTLAFQLHTRDAQCLLVKKKSSFGRGKLAGTRRGRGIGAFLILLDGKLLFLLLLFFLFCSYFAPSSSQFDITQLYVRNKHLQF